MVSIWEDSDLDFALVAIKLNAAKETTKTVLRALPSVNISRNEIEWNPKEETEIIAVGFPYFDAVAKVEYKEAEEHPKVFASGILKVVLDDTVGHTAFTLEGSSGSLVFNARTGKIVALHRVH